ncbi:hypothetical protein [Aliiroseovarius sp. 2305UL8-7]|uniref:hypothetical protein n=1 Tax=Aliiroseovarius conchicola TaxID=3121637 RepID=UPI00352753A9
MIRACLVRLGAAGLICVASPLLGAEVEPVSYDLLATSLAGHVDFETYETLPEPGTMAVGVQMFPGLSIGSQLAGQRQTALTGADSLTGVPSAPLRAALGDKPAAFAVAYHAGFGSNAAFPLGPVGFAQRSGRGEGALALVFKHDIADIGLKLHADYLDPLGTRPVPGPVTLTFFDNAANEIASYTFTPTHGIFPLGLHVLRPFRAMTITHDDPGGITVDDLRYPLGDLNS